MAAGSEAVGVDSGCMTVTVVDDAIRGYKGLSGSMHGV